MNRLKLQGGTRIRRIRKRYYDDYKNGRLTINGLEDYAPLVAEAVNALQAAGQALP